MSKILGRKQTFGDRIFQWLSIGCIFFALSILVLLIGDIIFDGASRINLSFFNSFPSRFPEKAGIKAALAGSLCLMLLVILITTPLGIGAAIYLEEYAPKNKFTRFIELNIANLAGVPSVIYGLLGLQLFVRYLHFDRSLIAGALTLSLLILPVIIIASREALRTVPNSIREGAFALGATKWQAVFHQVLPVALPTMMTGCILAFSRAIGEAAPLITIGALTYIPFLPDGIFSPFTALPIQSFNWLSRPQEAFHANAAAAIIVLLVILLGMNSLAIWLRHRFQRKLQ